MFKRSIIPVLLVFCAFGGLSAPAQAVTEGTGWHAFSFVFPTTLAPGGKGSIKVAFVNTGAKQSQGPITVTDTLPAGVTATKAGGLPAPGTATFEPLSPQEEESGEKESGKFPGVHGARWVCTGNGSGERDVSGATTITCTSNPAVLEPLPSGKGNGARVTEEVEIAVNVGNGMVAGTYSNGVVMSGGGASAANTVSDPVSVGSGIPGFGVAAWEVWFSNADGTTDTQAGSHPYDATFAINFNQVATGENAKGATEGGPAGGEARNLEAVLPPGFFGDPSAVPKCTRAQLDGQNCPAATQIGTDEIYGNSLGAREGVYNMVPPPGVPDEFAISVGGFHANFDAGVRSGNGYGIVEHVTIPYTGIVGVAGDILTLWGVPAEASHNPERRTKNPPSCNEEGCPGDSIATPFLTLPTSCTGPQVFSARELSTWNDGEEDPDAPFTEAVTRDDTGAPVGFTGCEHLTIEPSITAIPDTGFADTPAGLNVEVTVPQENLLEPEGLVAATLKDTSVALPEGLVINPGQAAGLAACGEAEANIHGDGPPSCPNASKVGTDQIKTPLLEGSAEKELAGSVYVLQANPPESEAAHHGLRRRREREARRERAVERRDGPVHDDGHGSTRLPITSFRLAFSGGAQAALAHRQCGTTRQHLTSRRGAVPSYRTPFPTSWLVITSGLDGSACLAGPLPFSPRLTAGATTDQAGGFTSFSLLLQRFDGQQRIERLQFTFPAGLGGMSAQGSAVPRTAGDARANAPPRRRSGTRRSRPGPARTRLTIPQPGDPGIPDVPHRALWGRTVRPVDRDARDRWPVQPRARS